uniref:Uncharacterized protein n=1 Tax=Anguilla anguilla TaxID=7936 RepID=A0A0E9V467_ANGAN
MVTVSLFLFFVFK